MYKLVKKEYELAEDEQEKATFIIETANRCNEDVSMGMTGKPSMERLAFEAFKYQFYSDLRVRLSIYNLHDAMTITSDGKKLIHLTIEKA